MDARLKRVTRTVLRRQIQDVQSKVWPLRIPLPTTVFMSHAALQCDGRNADQSIIDVVKHTKFDDLSDSETLREIAIARIAL